MRAVIQRVSEASVSIDNSIFSEISTGLLILLGIEIKDTEEDSLWLANKIAHLRIFTDEQGVMNNAILDIEGDIIVVSQFTLHARTKRGNRPSYMNSAKAEQALPLYKQFKQELSNLTGKDVFSGKFSEDMKVTLVNDGPVTIIIDTMNKE